MSKLKDMAKGGWHPKGKDGKKESWRGDFKGVNQISGWMGKGKDSSTEAGDHVSRPLSTLKDPSEFGPPPKHVDYYGAGTQGTPRSEGLGAPLSQEYINETQAQKEAEREAEEQEAAKPKPPPMPYRVDTTGLSTSNLPPPPGRKDREQNETPPQASKRKPPGLPPRLPPRQDSSSSSSSPTASHDVSTAPPDPHKGILNQGSLNRLGAAGISVPGLGVGESKSKPPLPPPSLNKPSHTSPPSQQNNSQLNELQSRFSRLSPTSPKPESPSEGTSFAQKRAAMKTATDFRNDPSSVSFKDAKTAASTANNFRERHGDQVASGWQSANKLNSKYGLADKVGGLTGTRASPTPPPGLSQGQEQENTPRAPASNRLPDMAGLAKKKPPPPPPMKKPGLASSPVSKDSGAPPPIPLSSKPRPPVS